jgi:siroheme synthase-like protein
LTDTEQTRRPALPVFLLLDQKPCLVIGGGHVACRKAEWLLESGAHVHVIAREVGSGIRALERRQGERLSVQIAEFRKTRADVTDYALVISACGDEEINRMVHAQAIAVGVPVNVADVPELCSFYVPATVRRGPVCLAIGTGGKCPGLAKHLRQRLDAWLPDWYGRFAEALADTRLWLRSLPDTSAEQRHAILATLVDDAIIDSWRESSADEMKAHMRDMVKDKLDSVRRGS